MTNIDAENGETTNAYLTDSEDKYLLDKLGVYLTTINKKENEIMATKKYVSLEKLGLYDGKIKGVISAGDNATLQSAKDYADSLATNYDGAGSAASALEEAKAYADGKDTAIEEAKKAGTDAATAAGVADGKAVAAQTAADNAQADVDALELLVGTLPEGTSAKDVVDYVNVKTAGIATDAALGELQGQLSGVQGEVATIKGDYLKAADKTELQGKIDAEAERAAGVEGGLDTRVKAIEDDYLKGSDKEELQGNIDTVSGAVERLTNGVSAEEIDGVNDLIQYVKDHGTEVTGMQEDIADNASAIEGVAGRMTTAEGKITAVEGAVATKAEKTYVDEADEELSKKITALEGKFTEGDGSVSDMISSAVEEEATRVDGLLDKKVDKVEGKDLSTNDLTNELKANYDAAYTHSQAAHAPVEAQANVIESVKVNGSALTITDKVVDIAVPTDNAELTNGAGYLVASDIANKADKGTTLAAYGIADAYTSAQTDSAIEAAIGQFIECSEQDILDLFQ